MKIDSLKEFNLNSFREVNFELRDVLYFLGEDEIDESRVLFEMHFDFEKRKDNLFEIYLHVIFAYKYSREENDDAEKKEAEEIMTLMHVDFVCLFTFDTKNKKKGIPIIALEKILKLVIGNSRGYLFAKLPSYITWIPIIPEINTKELIEISEIKTKGKWAFPD